MTQSAETQRFDVAIVGMAGRFPGARSLAEYWDNLRRAVETIRIFSEEELLARGVDQERIRNPYFVPAGAPLEGADQFAASFFGFSPGEAEWMDPQHRLFLECSWEALENAGYAPRSLGIPVGIFAGTSLSTYMLFNLLGNPAVDHEENSFQLMIGSDKDFLSTRISYKLNFKGPSFTIQCGCSTSLVAVHLAVQNLLTYQCDLALAGGVSVGVPQRTGYLYQPDGIVSPDGHCRAFDAEGAGTLFGEGIGIVVLKRMEDALRDRDTIHAVILGSAINNDGSEKVGYTAPGIEGQAEVIARAQALAGVTADTIGYVEAHGTATALGDPVEIAALTKAFRQSTQRKSFCGIGSVKTNMGHLDAAAGIAGLIKAALMLKHKAFVPSLHYRTPNPALDLENGPFFVASAFEEWKSERVRRAGVSSFGIGGTNAHVILEEPPVQPAVHDGKPVHILSISAQTETALDAAALDLAAALEGLFDEALPDVAYTLHLGREAFRHRRSVVCSGCSDAASALRLQSNASVFTGRAAGNREKAAFLFPGGGTQYPGMGKQLYQEEAEFRKQVDLCAGILQEQLQIDLRSLLYSMEKSEAAARLASPGTGLPAIFVTEFALAQLLISWGIQPACMLGHSLGEYTAACLSGVFSLEDALSLVAFRGRLFETLPGGSMLSVYLSEEDARPWISPQLSVAAINGPGQCVISGPSAAIDRMTVHLASRDIEFQRLHIDAAAHSAMVEPVMQDFYRFISKIKLRVPQVPFISNLTGTWITGRQASDPNYWVDHLRQTVRFADGLKVLLQNGEFELVEVGPARNLSTLAKGSFREHRNSIHAAMRHPHDDVSDLQVLYSTVAKLWNAGLPVDWNSFYSGQQRRRVPLPSYPFERQRYWIEPPSQSSSTRRDNAAAQESGDKIYVPIWETETISPERLPDLYHPGNRFLIFMDGSGVGQELREHFRARGTQVFTVHPGREFRQEAEYEFSISPASDLDCYRVIQAISGPGIQSLFVIYLWSLTAQDEQRQEDVDGFAERRQAFYCPLALLKSLGSGFDSMSVHFLAATNSLAQVSGDDQVRPHKSLLTALCRVVSQEFENVLARIVDFSSRPKWNKERIASQVLAEIASTCPEALVAYRGTQRWKPAFRPFQAQTSDGRTGLRDGGVYLITGGLGELGPLIASSFAGRVKCRLVIAGRTGFPEKSEWRRWSEAPTGDKTKYVISRLKEIEASGSEVIIAKADVTDEDQMRSLIDDLYARFGSLDGIVHLAGITGIKALRLVPDLEQEECERQFAPKVKGCSVLAKILQGRRFDFCVAFSSTATVLAGAGLSAYAAANSFVDAFARLQHLETGQRWIAINWDAWLTDGAPAVIGSGKTALDEFALPGDEALALLHRILQQGDAGQYVVSAGSLPERLARQAWPADRQRSPAPVPAGIHDRPVLGQDYVAPTTDLQRGIASVWEEVLGVAHIGLNDNLFELGGNSLLGLRIVSRLQRKLNISVPVTALFEGPTVLALSQLIAAEHIPKDYQSSRTRGEKRRQKRVLNMVRN